MILFLIIVIPNIIICQKHDHVWVFGNTNETIPINENFGGSFINFNYDPLLIYRKNFFNNKNNLSETCVSYSNRQGELKLTTNGLTVIDTSLNMIENGDSLELGTLTGYDGNASRQSALILEWPDDSTKCAIIYSDSNYTIADSGLANSKAIYYAVVDFQLNNGKGAITKKNIPIISRKISTASLTACKHANGRDWWIIKQGLAGNKFNKILFQPSGFVDYGVQEMEFDSIKYANAQVQTCFSPDGNLFTSVALITAGPNLLNRLFVADFDRCTGNLSTKAYFPIHTNKNFQPYSCGAAISADSRYLYASYYTHVYQYDLTANNIEKTKDTVAIWDGVSDPFPTTFYTAQLAPDGKIYIAANNGMRYMHVIEHPERKGDSCNLIQRGLVLPTQKSYSMQNHPNYRLGPLKGSPCDTISVATKDIKPEDYGIQLFPNPANDQIKINITIPQYDPTIKTEVVVVAVSGAIVMRYVMPDFAYLATLDISKLPSGVYGVQLRQPQRSGAKVLATEKLVVIR